MAQKLGTSHNRENCKSERRIESSLTRFLISLETFDDGAMVLAAIMKSSLISENPDTIEDGLNYISANTGFLIRHRGPFKEEHKQ